MNTAAPPDHQSITQSPWYWAYVFCTAGLIALVVMAPRYAQRQAQIEQNGRARQRAAQLVAGQSPSAPTTNDGPLSVMLWPLFVVLGTVLAVAWIKLLRDHFQRRSLDKTRLLDKSQSLDKSQPLDKTQAPDSKGSPAVVVTSEGVPPSGGRP